MIASSFISVLSIFINAYRPKALKVKYNGGFAYKHNFFRNTTSTGDIFFSKTSTSADSVSLKVSEHNYITKSYKWVPL